MKRMLVCTVALLALAGCGKKETAATGTATTASATAPAATTALPTAPPVRKAGLWEQTMTAEGMNQSVSMCLDDAVARKMSLWGQQMGQQTCEKNVITPRPGGGWTFSSVCEMGSAGRIVSEGVASGDFASHYTVDINSTTTGAAMPQANGDHKMHMEATWKGACPADMRAGDMVMPGGMKINMVDMLDGAPKPGQRPTQAQMQAMAEAMKKQNPQ